MIFKNIFCVFDGTIELNISKTSRTDRNFEMAHDFKTQRYMIRDQRYSPARLNRSRL